MPQWIRTFAWATILLALLAYAALWLVLATSASRYPCHLVMPSHHMLGQQDHDPFSWISSLLLSMVLPSL
jgi:hypothetical protein